MDQSKNIKQMNTATEKCGAVLDALELKGSLVDSNVNVDTLKELKEKATFNPSIIVNEIFPKLNNLVVMQMTMDEFHGNRKLFNLFVKTQFLLGDEVQLNLINIVAPTDYDAGEWVPPKDAKYQPDITQQYIKTDARKKIQLEFEYQMVLGAFTSEVQFNSFIAVYTKKIQDSWDMFYFQYITAKFPLLAKKFTSEEDHTLIDNPNQIITIPVADLVDAKKWLPVIWDVARELSKPNTLYNGRGEGTTAPTPYTTWSNPSDMVFIINSKYLTKAQFEAYASLFNQQFANLTEITEYLEFLTPAQIGTRVVGTDTFQVIGILASRDSIIVIPRIEIAGSQYFPMNNKVLNITHSWLRSGVYIGAPNVVFLEGK